ncbi:PREDICTED: 2-carboxy-1,4-naphthoquinone phytyltransferase, chloroplastic-like isoform X2 [Camelina sativa]|uniref:2-carboxy-1,4-naphthoquinone phytyltransferase, chloroplastic-like isoform X2 n=1 Tax=Camelina sativa TaxID=90675 RepID=A0ABM1RR74_CAMSA|nr:PREDICTED: 2-carboxy-1,4-naphthoquinone phytyltransferase, chloroplastic-like isoform X2 [Camelina sativa]
MITYFFERLVLERALEMMNLVSLCDITHGLVPKKSTDLFVKPRFTRGYGITRLPLLELNSRENLNAKRIRNLRAGPIFCKSYGDAAIVYQEEEIPKAKLIWRAIKLPIYSVALVPLTVGASAAYIETGLFLARRYATLMLSSILIITWLNLSNDVYDFDTGADKNKKESVVNLLGSRAGTLAAAITSLMLGVAGLVWTSLNASNIRAILLLASAILCGYVYQCPPFRLSYQGLGEPLCFAAFGPFATTAFYLLLGSSSEMRHLPLSGRVLSSSLLVGFTTSLILFCSHFHQVDGDLAVGKYSPLVRLGTEKGALFVRWAIRLLYSMLLVLGLTKILPLPCALMCFLTLPVGNLVSSYVEKHHKENEKIFMAKYYCVRLHALFGTALSLGLVIAG